MYAVTFLLVTALQSAYGLPSSGKSAKALRPREYVTVDVCDKNLTNYKIYCSGDILAAVNILGLYDDSKTFVDMPLKQDPDTVDGEFHKRFGATSLDKIDPTALRSFVNEFFAEAGTELEDCVLPDWQENPPKLMRIADPKLRKWALELNAIWKKLCRKMKDNVNNDHHSLIYVPNQFVVPGGRFREFYYWDTYWIVKGLLASGMINTTKAILGNFESVVQRYGFVPNGGRIYYLRRSQPPMLSPMVYEYFEETQDFDLLKKILPTLEKELQFWLDRRTINVTGQNNHNYTVFQYRTESNVPRPESYRPDYNLARNLSESERPQFYQDIASAAESGWDFSTRWFADKKSLIKIETTKVVPIDLNALLCWNMDILHYFYRTIGDTTSAEKYSTMRYNLRDAMQYVFYNETQGAWFDYNLRTARHNVDFYPSVAIPLFAECYTPLNLVKSQRIVEFMNNSGAFNYPGGVPTSLVPGTGQQWDFPNGWSPLEHMIIEGLRKSDSPFAQQQAVILAQKWVSGNYKVYSATGGKMWEKYDVNGTVPAPGAGGEYDVQDGFGWTNGAVLDLLSSYPDWLSAPADGPTSSPASTPSEGTSPASTPSEGTAKTAPKSDTSTSSSAAKSLASSAGLLVTFAPLAFL